MRKFATAALLVRAMFTSSTASPLASQTFVGKMKSIPPLIFQVLVGDVGSKSGTAFVVMLSSSTNSSALLSFVPLSGGWYMISEITMGPTFGPEFVAPGVKALCLTKCSSPSLVM